MSGGQDDTGMTPEQEHDAQIKRMVAKLAKGRMAAPEPKVVVSEGVLPTRPLARALIQAVRRLRARGL
jgi:hypothetical protein